MNNIYCNSLTNYSRFKTREVNVGGIPLGGNNPIRIQSMTTTNTLDTQASVEQCIRIIKAGADYVRLTAPGTKEAENLANIKTQLRKLGYNTPLVADIHFNPRAAEIAAAIVEKVRINPGNYVDTKRFENIEYTEQEYKLELEKLHQRVLPLINICKEHGTAVRIGVNHGSLSDRIMSRFGDSPAGMVESAMEFLRIFQAENYHQLVISLKASNTRVMVQAYRLMLNKMMSEGMNYPLHLGVTEAGDGEDGRVKSAVGIGALLADGIGDTIRVSLSEEPEAEVPVAQKLVSYFTNRAESEPIILSEKININPFDYGKRPTSTVSDIGGLHLPCVITDWYAEAEQYPKNIGQPDFWFLNNNASLNNLPIGFRYILNYETWVEHGMQHDNEIYPLLNAAEYLFHNNKHDKLNFVLADNNKLTPLLLDTMVKNRDAVLVLETFNLNGMAEQRAAFYNLMAQNNKLPVIINRNYCEDTSEDIQLKAASDVGALLLDGLGDGVWIRNIGNIQAQNVVSVGFALLQASRVRTTKTEYISCPSCGRTLFDLQTTIARIKEKTSHLKHLKIGIMGCIVNGPGEMADADYGYVGAGPGKITLYKGKEIIKRSVDANEAVNELVGLIKNCGDWVEAEG